MFMISGHRTHNTMLFNDYIWFHKTYFKEFNWKVMFSTSYFLVFYNMVGMPFNVEHRFFLTTVILIWTISIYCDLLTLRIKLNEIFIVTFILSKKCTVHHFAWDPYIRQLYKIIHCHYFDINKNTFLCLFPYLGPSWSDLQLPVQSVPITTKVVSLNPVHGEVYSIQYML
jgi:hypothetical protein